MDNEWFKELSKPFSVEQVKQRKAGFGDILLDYVGWDTVVARLNKVIGSRWDTDIIKLEYDTETGDAICALRLVVFWDAEKRSTVTSRCGVGADRDKRDPDKAVKTAMAEALKKAANQYGVALELWDKDHREDLAKQRVYNADKLRDLKEQVWNLARSMSPVETAEDVAALFTCKIDDLQQERVLEAILGQHKN